MRTVGTIAMIILLAGCAGREYKDNSAQLASDPRCMDKPSIPDAEPAPWCKPGVEANNLRVYHRRFSGKGKPD